MNREIEARLKISAVDRTEQAFRSVAGRLRQVERQVEAYNRAERQAAAFRRTEAAASGALLTNARLLGGAAVAAGITQTVRAFSSYEDALVEIQKKGGFTADQIAQVGQEARALATSGELAVPLEEILGAYERGAAAGLPLEELREFARLSAMAADAFGMSATAVGDASAGFNKALGVPMAEMERLFDLINSLADAGIADESGIVEYIDRAGAMSKTFGLTVQETAALGAALTNLKVPASQAATAMNSILTKILAPDALSGDARQALGALVGDFDDLEAAITENADEALVDLLRKLRDLDKVKRTGIIADLFGQEHLDVVSQLVEGLDEVERNLAVVSSTDWFGSLARSYQLKLGTMSAKWQDFKNQIGELAIDIGSMGLPAMESGLEAAKGIVGEIDAGLRAFSETLDRGAIEDAKIAIFGVRDAVGELSQMEAGDGEIVQFFKTLADVSNDVAGTIEAIGKGIEFLKDPMGLAQPDGENQTVWDPFGVGPETFSISTTKGSPADWLANLIASVAGGASDFADWANERHDAAAEAATPEGIARARQEQLSNVDPTLSLPSLGVRVGPFVGNDPELAAAVEARWQEILRAYENGPTVGTTDQQNREVLGSADPSLAPTLAAITAQNEAILAAVHGGPVEAAYDPFGAMGDAPSSPEIDASSDALRIAMEQGGIAVVEAGTQAGSALETSGAVAGQAFSDAAGAALAGDAASAGAAFGRAAAQAFNASIRLPNGAVTTPRPNANLGRSMPNVGTPGL